MKRLLVALVFLAAVGCKTVPPENTPPPAVVITWPEFPDPKGIVVWNDDGTVVMPADYWLKVARYVIDVDKVRDLVEGATL